MDSSQQESSSPVIGSQLHSRNDVREWNALFRKGATSLKIDPHYIPGHDQFLLNHDTPLIGEQPYSTLKDVLEYLESPPSWLSGRSISIALCFKAAPKDLCDPEPSSEAQQWRQMANNFFQQANRTVALVQQQFGIALTFVLDGDAKPCGCLADAFLPWNSTWIDRDSCSLECYHSDEGYCKRYTVLNQPYNLTHWQTMTQTHYGKFGLNTQQTLQVWEPDEQSKIFDLIDVYTKARYLGVPSGSGLAFAINVDVSMFQVFAARALAGTNDAQGFNRVVDPAVNASKPRLVLEPSPTAPLQMTLQYDILDDNNPTQRVKRALSFQPFAQIVVGPARPVVVPPEEDASEEESEFFQTQLRKKFGTSATTTIDSKSALYNIGNGGKHQYSFLFVAWQGQVYAGATNHSQTADFTGFSILGLGTQVHASSLHNTILLVTQGNYCYNSHVHNTQSVPLVCEPQINTSLACPYALDYTVGVAENWYRWLLPNNKDDAVITPCNEYLLHGTMTAGHNPWGALFPMPSAQQVGIMVAHEPYPSSEESHCGTPYRGEQGIVLSSFASVVVPAAPWGPTTTDDSSHVDPLRILLLSVAGVGIALLGWVWWRRRRRAEDYESVQS